jgi:hypothetical protein
LCPLGFLRWYVNVPIAILDINHRLALYLKQDISETKSSHGNIVIKIRDTMAILSRIAMRRIVGDIWYAARAADENCPCVTREGERQWRKVGY